MPGIEDSKTIISLEDRRLGSFKETYRVMKYFSQPVFVRSLIY